MDQAAILGLSINTRMLGLAVVMGSLLVDYHIQLRKDSWSPRKRELILTSLQPWCESYNIKRIALSISYAKQTSRQTKELLEAIKGHFSKKEIGICTYPPQTIYSFCQEGQKKTKKTAMRNIADLYPELSYQFQKEMTNKNKYYVKLFEAVGVATIHSRELKERRRGTEL